MSASESNLERQKRRHVGPLLGMGIVVALVLGLLFWWTSAEVAQAPGPDSVTPEASAPVQSPTVTPEAPATMAPAPAAPAAPAPQAAEPAAPAPSPPAVPAPAN